MPRIEEFDRQMMRPPFVGIQRDHFPPFQMLFSAISVTGTGFDSHNVIPRGPAVPVAKKRQLVGIRFNDRAKSEFLVDAPGIGFSAPVSVLPVIEAILRLVGDRCGETVPFRFPPFSIP